jgi:GntR family transcriptional regulator
MMHIERDVSLASQIARALRLRLRHDYPAGGRLPSEPDMAAAFGVSRGTVRQALTILEREGAIFRRHGSGTYANRHVLRIQTRAEMAYEFTDLLRLAGFDASIRLLAVATQPLPDDVAGRLNGESASEGLVVRKLFLADQHPAIFCVDMIPTCAILAPYDDAELRKPIFEFLEHRCHQSIDYCVTEIVPEVADQELGTLLEIVPGRPFVRFDEVGYSKANEPVLFSRVYYNDRYIRFSVLRKKV